MKSGGFLHEARHLRQNTRPTTGLRAEAFSAARTLLQRSTPRHHTHLVVRQQAFALDAPRRSESCNTRARPRELGGATVDAGCGVTSRTEGRPRSVPSLVQPRRQSPRRPARGQTRIAACLATLQRLAHGLATLRKGHQVVCVHFVESMHVGAPDRPVANAVATKNV